MTMVAFYNIPVSVLLKKLYFRYDVLLWKICDQNFDFLYFS